MNTIEKVDLSLDILKLRFCNSILLQQCTWRTFWLG